MGHCISTREFSGDTEKSLISALCNQEAIEEGDYHHGLDGGIRFANKILGSREEAHKWIEDNDSGWYDNLAIRFKDGNETNWLVKYEYHV